MDTIKIIAVSLALVGPALCQHYSQGGQEGQYRPEPEQYNYNRQPPPQILSHKQALNHDGNFKYLFTSDNGLAQGETIAPDGSRNGGYSYVDPNGRKISVKYTAGKEGFRILEADHLPKAPLPVAPLPAPQGYAAPQAYTGGLGGQGGSGGHDDGSYKPQLYQKPQYLNFAPAYKQQPISRPSYSAPLSVTSAPLSNNIEQREPDYNDEPGKPHSFGTGYIFEFAG